MLDKNNYEIYIQPLIHCFSLYHIPFIEIESRDSSCSKNNRNADRTETAKQLKEWNQNNFGTFYFWIILPLLLSVLCSVIVRVCVRRSAC